MRGFLIIAFFLVIGFVHSNAQSDVIRDNELWLGVEFNKDINKKWSSAFTTNLRRENNLGKYKQTYFQLALERKLKNNLSATVGYRYIAKSKDENNGNRLYTECSFKKKLIRRIVAGSRTRLQYDSDDPKLFENGELLLREKVGFEYKKKKSKMVPYCGTEFFLDLLNDLNLEKYRLYIGVKYELSKKQKINIKYIFQKGKNKRSFQTNIFSLDYSIKINRSKKKKDAKVN